MAFVIKDGNVLTTPDTEQLNQTLREKYGDSTFMFNTDSSDFSTVQNIVKKVSKNLDVVFEPLSGYVLMKGTAPERVYKRAVTTLKKQIKDIQVF